MIAKVDRGQITFSFNGAWIGKNGPGSGHGDGFRIQFYWPYYIVRKPNKFRQCWELTLSAKTVFRIVYETTEGAYFGIGFNTLGFGVAFDYQRTTERKHDC